MSGVAASGHDPGTDRAAALIGDLSTLKTDGPRIAEPMSRVTARIIDLVAWMIFGAFVTVAASSLDLVLFPDDAGTSSNGVFIPNALHPAVAWGSAVVIVVLAYLWEVVPTAVWGTHFAKRRLRLSVAGPDGARIGLGRASFRWFVWWVPLLVSTTLVSATFMTGWGFLFIALQFASLAIPGMLFFDDAHRGLHDRLAGTAVLAER